MNTPVPHLRRAALAATSLIAFAALVNLAATRHLVTPELSRRLLGIAFGVMAMVYASASTKSLTPLARLRCDPAAEQQWRRLVGWTLTLGALAYVGAWLVAPVDVASWLAPSLLGAALSLLALRRIRARRLSVGS